MQQPASYDLVMYQGASWDYTFTWEINNVVVNLTSFTARMQVRLSYSSTDIVLGLTSGSGITLGGALGTIRLAVNAVTTAAIPASSYVYDLELVGSTGEVTRLVEGKFLVTPEVTR
jgi:hypothetical protein